MSFQTFCNMFHDANPNDYIGDWMIDAFLDHEFPWESPVELIVEYLEDFKAPLEAIENFETIYEMYLNETSAQGPASVME